MANYNVDISIAIRNTEKLTAFNKQLDNSAKRAKELNQGLSEITRTADSNFASFNNLSKALREAQKAFNDSVLGTKASVLAARDLATAERMVNKELKERTALMSKFRFQGGGSGFKSFSQSASQIKSPNVLTTAQQKSINRHNKKFGILPSVFGPQQFIGPMPMQGPLPMQGPMFGPMQGPMPMQGPLQMMTVDNNPRILRNIAASQAGRQGSNFGFGLAGDPIAKSIRRNRQLKFKHFLREKKENKEIRDLKAQQLKLERANNKAVKERVNTTKTLAKTTKAVGSARTPGASRTGGGFFRGGARGALSNAMIGGGFPLLFGQGALGAAGGGIGGALGGAIGGGFGFSLSIIGTAIAQRIQEAIDFRKEIEKVNTVIQETGGTSKISAYDITSLSKSLKITKEEALEAANAFAAFGAQSALALAETFKDRSTFDLYANLNKDAQTFIGTVETLFKNNELGIKQAKEALGILDQRGLKEASVFIESLKFQKSIKKEISEQVPLQRDINAAQATYESFFDRMSGRPLQNYMLLNEERKKEIQMLITAEGQMEAREGTEEERFNKKMANVRAEIEAQRELTKTIERQLIIQQPRDELERLIDPLIQVDALGKSIGASFSESFKGIVRGSMTAQQALANLFQRTADHFLDMSAQILAAQIRSGIFGIFSSFIKKPTPTFNNPPPMQSGAYNTGIPYKLEEGSFNITKKAMGGPVKGGGSYMVGEKGPELFTPGVSGNITPNHALGGSTNVVVNVDASGSSVQGDDQSATALGELIGAAVQAEIINQKMDGGLLS